MEIKEIQKKINEMNYWDSEILDFKINYFGDEIELFIEDTIKECYRLTFLYCYKVTYENDAKTRWNNMQTKKMNKRQLDFYAHDIVVKQSEEEGFLEFKLELPFLFAKIICKDINIDVIDNDSEDFFWLHNK